MLGCFGEGATAFHSLCFGFAFFILDRGVVRFVFGVHYLAGED